MGGKVDRVLCLDEIAGAGCKKEGGRGRKSGGGERGGGGQTAIPGLTCACLGTLLASNAGQDALHVLSQQVHVSLQQQRLKFSGQKGRDLTALQKAGLPGPRAQLRWLILPADMQHLLVNDTHRGFC